MKRAFSLTVALAFALAAGSAFAGDISPLRDRIVGYVLTNYFFSMHTTEQKTECPDGLNDGPVAQFNMLFPKDGKKRAVVDTELKREAEIWFPNLAPEPFKFKEPVSTVAPGMNLDGKVGANDFTSPDGERGIDNQFYRVIGCIADYRPGGSLRGFHNMYLRDRAYTRLLLELTDVDSLTDDNDVTVTTYRGLDPLPTDASGNEILPNGTERVDARYGKVFHKRFHGKIANGVLITDSTDLNIPIIMAHDARAFITVRDSRLKLSLTPDDAKGMWGGYFDIESFYSAINITYATSHQNYGAQSAPSVYRALYRLADAHPDPATGRNTAISAAMDVAFKQAFIQHPNKIVSSDEKTPQKLARETAR